ncbi:helix-turn-helix domain-containing protein [Streptomyces sp. NPDC006971]|uniref:helix-turn-helix domain-containing protein n=1 Tax=Streptomyces sp. NPDC006971 TaxID=3154784 RepID=UPI0033E1E1B3
MTEIDDAAQWLTVNEVAQYYRVAPRTVGRWVASGQIRSKRIGHRTGTRSGVIRIHRSVIEEPDTPTASAA